MAIYTVEIRDQYGRLVTVLKNPQSKEYYLYRNKPGSFQFTLDAYDVQATEQYIKLNQYDVVVRRSGTPVFAGQISYVNPIIDESDKAQIQITATGYFDLFQQRMITSAYPGFTDNQLVFSNTDGGSVIQTLITDCQFPLYSDATVKLQDTTPLYSQSFISSGTANLKTIKLLLQNQTLYTGTVSSATSTTLTDNSQSWATNALAGARVSITGGTDINDLQVIASNTSNTLTLYSTTSTGTVTSSTPNSLTDTGKSWLTNALVGRVVSITGGTDLNDAQTIISNTSNTIVVNSPWLTQVDVTSNYSIEPALTGNWLVTPDNTSTYRIQLDTPLTTGNLIIGIYTDNQGVPSTTLVPNSQLTLPVSGISSTQGWYTATYTGTLPALTQGTKYWITCYLDTTQATANGILWSYLNPSNGVGYYQNGNAYNGSNPVFFTSQQSFQFFVQLDDNSYQMTKNTYLGINIGTIETSFNIDRTYSSYKIIKQAIEEIAQLHSGIDFNITVQIDSNNLMTKYFNVFYPRQGVDNLDLNFSFPGNIIAVNKSKDGKSMFNSIYTRGQGTGVNQVVTTSPDPVSIQAYGLREETSDYSDIPDATTLQSIGDELIRIQKDPLEVPDIILDGNSNPQIGSYGLGDTILITATGPGLLNFIEEFRIEEIHVIIDDDGREKVELTSSKA